ncbi:hypothetical protein IZH86_05215 [Campylobacter coli]|nr:hypothetical protein [Campylobacter jejuni]MBX0406462.1 hypothetical protein [Campylobacter coli]EDP4879317.1 hypothetical protein [Campylobacter jejuni]EDP6097710.1 hypothetical protein [Campylobacter jejuni]MBX0429012.1 hypothetical protein [Campylobacter jejuni]
MLDYEKFQTMSKEEYFKKYNVGIRFLFGCDLNQKNETEMISLRVFLPKKHFQEYKNIDIFKTMDLFKETLLFKGLTEQSIKIDFEKREFVMPDFFIINDIEIIPYFTQGGEKEEELSKEKFFELLKQNKIKELNYLCFLFFGLFCEEEYKYFCKANIYEDYEMFREKYNIMKNIKFKGKENEQFNDGTCNDEQERLL